MQRIDYGASYKYHCNPSLSLLAPSSSTSNAKQELSLLTLNPHGHSLGLRAQDFVPSTLCAGFIAEFEAAEEQAAALAASKHGSEGDTRAVQHGAAETAPIQFVPTESEEDNVDVQSEGEVPEQPDTPVPAPALGGVTNSPAADAGQPKVADEGSMRALASDLLADDADDACNGSLSGSELTAAADSEVSRSRILEKSWTVCLFPEVVDYSPLLKLHNEVVAFTKMLEPTPEEVDSRSKSMSTVREVVNSIWPSAQVVVFGSYETGLYTPASDTDIVVVDSGLLDAQKGLRALAHALQQRQLVRNLQQVLTARVPIIKFEMIESGLAFDVSWEVKSGPQGAGVVKALLQQWPVMRPLVLVLKVFLTQRELNEVYQGGIGSYSLIIMVAAFLQLHSSRRPAGSGVGGGGGNRKRGRNSGTALDMAAPLEANLGLLLLDFF
eukprot:gene10713-10869_t